MNKNVAMILSPNWQACAWVPDRETGSLSSAFFVSTEYRKRTESVYLLCIRNYLSEAIMFWTKLTAADAKLFTYTAWHYSFQSCTAVKRYASQEKLKIEILLTESSATRQPFGDVFWIFHFNCSFHINIYAHSFVRGQAGYRRSYVLHTLTASSFFAFYEKLTSM